MRRVMYVKPGCPYCDAARADMAASGVQWEERDATTRAEWRTQLMEHSRGTGLVPTILEDDRVITVGWKGKG